MKSTEAKESRLKMVDMHAYFLNRINEAIKNNNHIEACWLIYACFENRYFRTLAKFKVQCKYGKGKCKKTKNELALRTKIRCVERLMKANVRCVSEAFSQELFDETLKWVKQRNDLMHDLLTLESYEDAYENKFKELADKGLLLLNKTYTACTTFRKIFYEQGYEFTFPEACMEQCSCKPHNEGGEEI